MEDVRIFFTNFRSLVFNVLVKTVMNGSLELIEIVDVLYYPVDSSFECLDVAFILTDKDPIALVKLVHLLLFVFQLIDDKAKISVDFVVFLEAFIHLVGFKLEGHYFLFTRSNVAFKLLDLEVQHVLEFLKLLCLFLKNEDPLLTFGD